MKNRWLFFSLLFVLPVSVFGQEGVFVIRGRIADKNGGKPIEGVHISVKGGYIGTTSDKNGNYSIQLNRPPLYLTFSHVSYFDVTIYLKDSASMTINLTLEEEIMEIGQVDVSAKKMIRKVVGSKSLTILDYEFYDDYLLFIGHKPNKRAELILLKDLKDTLCKLELEDVPEKLYKDCQDVVHLIAEKNCYQVHYDGEQLLLLYPVSHHEFEEAFLPCVESHHGIYYLRQYLSTDQIIQYYYYSLFDSTLNDLVTIVDEKSLIRIADYPRFMSMGKEMTEADIRFEQIFFMDPIFAPMIKLRDTLCILNFVDSKLLFYDSKAKFIREVSIEFHKDRQWKEVIATDEIRGKIYCLFRKNGISTLLEINLSTGKAEAGITIPSFVFIDKISVRDGVVYFMYTNRIEDENRTLYVMKLF